MRQMLVPNPWDGLIKNSDLGDLKSLPKNTWCSLYRTWFDKNPLPLGHDLYIISYHLDAIDLDWVLNQCKRITNPIILLSDSEYYDFPSPDNLHCYTYYKWHDQLDLINKWFPIQKNKNITHKASAVCHRISQSKLIVTTALLEQFGHDDCLIILDDVVDDDLTYNKQHTGSEKLDKLSDYFWQNLYGKKIKLDDFDQSQNHQRRTSDPWFVIYQSAALHFTNESFHYSLMHMPYGKFFYPGPFLTEKTFKCLIGGTGFVPVGQFRSYRVLEQLGFQFDYDFPIDFDQIPENIPRLEKIIELITYLKPFSAVEIFEMTKQSSQYNQNHILSGELSRICQKHNEIQIQDILEKFSN